MIRNILKPFQTAVLLYICFTLFMAVQPAGAAVLDFNIGFPTSGSIDYVNDGDGTPDALVGSAIDVDYVIGGQTPLNDGIDADCIDCLLSFTTGPLSHYNGSDRWDFSGGGTITIIGGVDFKQTADDIPQGTVLLTGTFTAASVIKFELPGNYEFRIAGGSFIDTKNEKLLEYYGLPADVLYAGGMNISFSAIAGDNDDFTSDELYSGDVTNTPVPVVSSLLLLGSGLAAGFFRRKKKA